MKGESKKISESFKNATLQQILTKCLEDTRFSFEIVGKNVVISLKKQSDVKLIEISGKVVDENGNSEKLQGLDAIRYEKALQADTAGTVTPQKVRQAVEAYQACLTKYGARYANQLPDGVYDREILPYYPLLHGGREAFADPDTGIAPSTLEIDPEKVACYSFWKKNRQCMNCISARELREKNQGTKLEFAGEDIYQVTACYMEIDGKAYVMELVKKLNEEFLLDAEGCEKLVRKLDGYNQDLYSDALTGSYNRRYYEERLKEKETSAGVAVIDLDDFKLYNDTYGHDAGD